MENNEIWMDIKNYNGIYQISSFGNVRSLHRKTPLIIKKFLSNTGYYTVRLTLNKITKYKSIHQLVAESFLYHVPRGILIMN